MNFNKVLINNFKRNFSTIFSNHELIPISSCRYGIEILLRALVIKEDKLNEKLYVILPAYTCQVVENAVLSSGCIPIYCDISKLDWSVSINTFSGVASKLILEKKNVIAFIMQHTFGITPKDRKKIIEFSSKNSIEVIEDIAHISPVEKYFCNLFKDKTSIVSSFQGSKSISSFQGGMLGISKIDNNLKNIVIKILKKEKQIFSIKLFLAQLIDLILNYLNYPYNSHKKIRSLVSYLYRGMNSYERNFKLNKYKSDFFRRGKANFFTLLFINLALLKKTKINKKRENINNFYNEKIPINNFIKNQVQKGNLLLLWPLISESNKTIFTNKLNKRLLSNWFEPFIFPNSSIVNFSEKGKYPVAEHLSFKCKNLYTLMTKKDQKILENIIKSN